MKNKNVPVCSVESVDKEKIKYIDKKMKSRDTLNRLAETFKALGDVTRLKIVFALSLKELCTCELVELTNISKSGISHQLRILKDMRLVKYRKEGKMVYYSLDDDHISQLFEKGLEHVEEQ
ncbi:MAG: ArsR family transcriptional regulator, lead/cadmium/zinc/bismuth-responsive transcriptional [Kosmotogales bacterium]|nr:ArsR family transcriptional regulator, lead/cadmium/zinc/bismuth-responsive transcriptional [Kosmotogales bacterium]